MRVSVVCLALLCDASSTLLLEAARRYHAHPTAICVCQTAPMACLSPQPRTWRPALARRCSMAGSMRRDMARPPLRMGNRLRSPSPPSTHVKLGGVLRSHVRKGGVGGACRHRGARMRPRANRAGGCRRKLSTGARRMRAHVVRACVVHLQLPLAAGLLSRERAKVARGLVRPSARRAGPAPVSGGILFQREAGAGSRPCVAAAFVGEKLHTRPAAKRGRG